MRQARTEETHVHRVSRGSEERKSQLTVFSVDPAWDLCVELAKKATVWQCKVLGNVSLSKATGSHGRASILGGSHVGEKAEIGWKRGKLSLSTVGLCG